MSVERFCKTWTLISLGLALCGATACRTPAWPAADLAQPGWSVKHGQAVWTPRHDAPDIAGELLWARRADGELFLEFQKTPFPLVTARWRPEAWAVEFVPERRTARGRGVPPARLGWLHLARALGDAPPARPWRWRASEDDHWRLENPHTGEVIEGFVEAARDAEPSHRP